MRLKAGTLFYAVFIAFLILSVVSAFMVYSFHHTRILQYHDRQVLDLINLRSAVELVLSGTSEEHYFDSDIVLFEEDELSEVHVNKRKWGLYDLVCASTIHSRREQFRSALVGAGILQQQQISLYLADMNKPLSLAGNSQITGPCILPESGIRRAYIEGRRFSGKVPSVVQGKHSENRLPPLSGVRIEYLRDLLKGRFGIDSLVDASSGPIASLIDNSWQGKHLVAYSNSKLVLREQQFKGPVIFYSPREIQIEACRLDGIICISPVIRVHAQAEGNVQLLASDSIVISGESHLKYPSALCLLDMDRTRENSPAVVVREGSRIQGDVILSSGRFRHKNKLILNISQQSLITGMVYVNGEVEHRGVINGTLFCESFLLKTPTSIYSNHLLDATIDRISLPENYCTSLIMESGENKIIKWLN